jgi:HTH-type transcriptional regulator/antitoxin HigA
METLNNIVIEDKVMNSTLVTLSNHWQDIAPLVAIPNDEEQYQERLDLLYQLVDTVGEDEQHPLASLLHFVGIQIAEYEKQHYPEPEATPQEVLVFLMQEHQLKQSDLPDIGSQGVVSEILNGKRRLNTRQIQALAQRFGISPSIFI